MCIRDRAVLPRGAAVPRALHPRGHAAAEPRRGARDLHPRTCLLYTSDAADERSSVDLGGRRIIKKKALTDVRLQVIM